MSVLKLLTVMALCLTLVESAKTGMAITEDELKDAMEEAEDVDDAIDYVHKELHKWGGDYKTILKGMPALKLMDNGITLAGSRDIQALAKAENRLAAAKQDVHEA